MSKVITSLKNIRHKNVSSLTDLATFVGKTAIPRKHRSKFWNAYKLASTMEKGGNKPNQVSDLLGMVLAISARTRRIIAPRTHIELDVFSPDGNRAVQLIMGKSH